jgi:hypothetical protein
MPAEAMLDPYFISLRDTIGKQMTKNAHYIPTWVGSGNGAEQLPTKRMSTAGMYKRL